MRREIKVLSWALNNFLLGRDFLPVYVTLKVTSRCNLSCTFCSPEYYEGRIPELSTEKMKKVIDNISKSSVIVVSFEGGEPTLRKDIDELLRHAHNGSLYTFMTTNGTLLNEEIISKVSDYLDFLHVSIDEYHWNTHLFERLSWLKEMGLKVTVQTVVTRYNMKKLGEKVRKVNEVGYRILVLPAVDYPNSKVKLSPNPFELSKVLEDIKREYSFTLVNSWGFIKALRGEIKPKIRPYSHALTVLPNGTLIYPNDIVGEPIGNLVEEDLMELVSSEKAKKMREIAIKRMHDYEYLHLQTASFNSFLDSLSYAKEMFKWKYLANGKKTK